MLGVPRRVPGRGDGSAAAGVPAPVPRRVHRPVAGRALDVPDLQVGDRPEHGSWQPASAGLAALGLGASHGFACVLGSEVRGRNALFLFHKLFNCSADIFQLADPRLLLPWIQIVVYRFLCLAAIK